MAMKLLSTLIVIFTILVVVVVSTCPNNCSGVGTCVANHCVCPPARGGEDCGVSVFPIGLVPPQLPEWTGNTYYGQYETFKSQLTLGTSYTFTVLDLSVPNRCAMYVGVGYIPSSRQFTYASTIPRNSTLSITVRPETVQQTTVYVGVTSSTWTGTCDYKISIAYTHTGPAVQTVALNYHYPMRLPNSKTENLNFLLHTNSIREPYIINMTSNCTNVLRLRYNDIPTTSYYYAVYYNYYAHTHYEITNNLPNSPLYFSLGRVYTADKTCVVDFVITQQSPSVCTSQCSLHGVCSYSTCRCNNDFYGSYCQLKNTALATNQVATGYIENGLANFYHYASNTINPLYIYFNTTSNGVVHTSNESCSFYLSKSTYPSQGNYDYSYTNIQSTYGNNVIIVVPQGGVQTWYMSVVGVSHCQYSFDIVSTSLCGASCVAPYGFCPSNSSGECQCLGSFTGPDCRSIATSVNGNGQMLSGLVYSGKWQYYRMIVKQPGDWKLSVTLVGDRTHLYVNEQSYTTLQGSTYNSTGSGSNQITLTNALPMGEYYYIGVYGAYIGVSGASYQLSVFASPF